MQEFNIVGHNIQLSTERTNFYKLEMKYNKLAEEAEFKLRAAWKRLGGFKAVAEKLDNDAKIIFWSLIDESIKYLQLQKVFSVDENLLAKRCEQFFYDEFGEDFETSVIEAYYEVMSSKAEAEQYRRDRKASRSKMVGYGFGISGALKASAQAGAFNAVTGMGHSVANILGNVGSSIDASSKLESLYKDKNRLDKLANGMKNVAYKIGNEVMLVVEKNTNIRYDGPAKSDREEAISIIRNLQNNKIPSENVIEYIVKALILNPFNPTLYEFAITKYGDKEIEIERMAAFFGYDMKPFKTTFVEKLYGGIEKKTFSSEEELLSLKKQIIEKCSFYGVEHIKYTSVLDDKWIMIDEELRTVEGVMYDTRTIANNVKLDILVYNDYVSGKNFDEINLLDQHQLQETIEQVKNLKYQTTQFLEIVENRIRSTIAPFIEKQIVISRLSNPNTFIYELKDIVTKSSFYEKMANRIKFSDFYNDKKNKAPSLFTMVGKPLLYEDNTLLVSWKKGIIITTRQLILFDKSTIEKTIELSEIKRVRRNRDDIVIETRGNTPGIEVGKISGLNANIADNYVTVISNIIAGISHANSESIETKLNDIIQVINYQSVNNIDVQDKSSVNHDEIIDEVEKSNTPVTHIDGKKDNILKKTVIVISHILRWIVFGIMALLTLGAFINSVKSGVIMLISLVFMCPITFRLIKIKIPAAVQIIVSIVVMIIALSI